MANATRTISGDPLWVSRNKRDPEALIFASGSLLFLLLAQNQPLKGRLDTCLDIQELKRWGGRVRQTSEEPVNGIMPSAP